MKEFNFNYFTAKNSVSIDDFLIRTKTGPFIKKEFPITNLQSFFIFYNNTYQSVFFIYTDDKGKSKKIQVFATPAEVGFTELVNELNARFPSKSLNHLSDAEAFKAMKVANPNKWAPFVAFFLILFVMCGILYPQLRHYFDYGFANTTVTEVGEKKDLGTRNINITGILLDKSLEETTTTTNKGSTTTTVSVYVPMVDSSWKEGDPVKVILSFDKLSDDEYSQVLESNSFTGVIRNVAWEGIESKQTDFLIKTYGLKFPDKPVLVQITNEKHNDEWVIFVMGLIVVILVIVFIIVAIKRRR
ncbi:MAG TPA: hypothetical protein VFJ43_06920 [Bacteroidia bacterium]|nr:hypothetical protein [Bacteroidia bacterium]